MRIPEHEQKYSFGEYLAQEEKADYKSEYYQGESIAVASESDEHSLISSNLNRELGNALMGSGCLVFSSDLKVRIEAENSSVYPDVMVICGPREYYQDRRDVVTNPTVVVEVLSDSTAAWDRGGKFWLYQLLPSLREYVLVEQKEARVDVFTKNEEGFWFVEWYKGLDKNVVLKSLGVEIAMSGIYYGVGE